MKVPDAEALRSLAPTDVAAWLLGHGWYPTVSQHRYHRFEKVSGGAQIEIDLPASQKLRDYARRMAEVLDVLEIIEGIDQLTLMRDIRCAQVDVARLRSTEPVRDYQLEGVIVKLESDAVAEGGSVVVVGSIDGRPCRVRVALGGKDYGEAVAAHSQEREIAIDGELACEAGRYTLRNPGPLRVLEQT